MDLLDENEPSMISGKLRICEDSILFMLIPLISTPDPPQGPSRQGISCLYERSRKNTIYDERRQKTRWRTLGSEHLSAFWPSLNIYPAQAFAVISTTVFD